MRLRRRSFGSMLSRSILSTASGRFCLASRARMAERTISYWSMDWWCSSQNVSALSASSSATMMSSSLVRRRSERRRFSPTSTAVISRSCAAEQASTAATTFGIAFAIAVGSPMSKPSGQSARISSAVGAPVAGGREGACDGGVSSLRRSSEVLGEMPDSCLRALARASRAEMRWLWSSKMIKHAAAAVVAEIKVAFLISCRRRVAVWTAWWARPGRRRAPPPRLRSRPQAPARRHRVSCQR